MLLRKICAVTFLLLVSAGCGERAQISQAEPTPPAPSQGTERPSAVDWSKKSPRFENLSIEQGLSQSVVITMLQDQRGFMWLATQDGLNRFDGNEFIAYKTDPDNPNSLSNGFVQALYEDKDGFLWIGTNGGGLNKFDPRSEQFTRYLPDSADPASLSHTAISSIAAAADGTLWLGTNGGGLNHFDPATGKAKAYHHDPSDGNSLSDDVVLTVAIAPDGTVWAGTLNAGLNHLDPATGKFTVYRYDPQNPRSLGFDCVQSLLFDSRGRLWIGTRGGGLSKRDGDAFARYVSRPQQDPFSLSDNVVQSIYEDRDGVLWVGTAQGGLNRFDEGSGRFYHYERDPLIPGSLSNNSVASIYQDRAGVYWIGTGGSGFDRFDPARIKFRHVFNDPRNPNSLLGSVVWSIFKDRSDGLWVGTADGLTQFAHDGTTRRYTNDPTNPQSLVYNVVYAMVQDRNAALWLGTAAGLSRFNPATKDFTNYGPGQAVILALLVDSQGTLWAGTVGSGLGKFDDHTGTFAFFSADPADPNGMGDNSAISLYEDRSGSLWVGTYVGGLCRFDKQTTRFTCYGHDPQNRSSISDATVLDMHEDASGSFWVATGGGGLNLFDRAAGTFTAFRERDGLPNDVVYGILEDKNGKLWLSTNNGLSRFDPADKTFRNYTAQDGLQSNEFDMGARFLAEDGEMFFGGINGFNSFYPDEIQDNPYIPPVIVTRFSLFNKPVVPGEDSPLQRSIPYTSAISLRYTEDFFGFDFASLHYSAPENIQYAYMLEGLDKDWNQAGNRRYAGYTNVPPGDYIFRVKATNSDGIWNEAGAEVHITITPPFWQTWWFRILAIVLIGAVVLGVFELRLNLVRTQKRQLEIQVDERTRELRETMIELEKSKGTAEAANRAKSTFLANVSHELRTPLNAILGFSQLLIRSALAGKDVKHKLSNEQLKNVKIINQSGEHLLGLINDVLEMSKIEAGRTAFHEQSFDLHHLLEGLEDMFRYRAQEKGLSLDVEISPTLPRYVSTDEGKLRQVLMNLLGNAVKYTMEGGIVLRAEAEQLQQEESTVNHPSTYLLHFSVIDTGLGIAPQEMTTLFRPFAQAASAQQVQEGTGLGLSISRQYAELMGGTLTAASQPVHGSTFTLQVPAKEADASGVIAVQSRRVVALAPGQEAYRILIVDDKPVNRALLVKLLVPLGFDIREAENGKAALEVWETWEPSAILMDMRMPIMDGYEATRRIKATVKGQATVIIAVTASALEEERSVILSEGCDDYIRKPFREQEIFDALERHLGVKFIYEQVEVPAETPRARMPVPGLTDQLALLSAEQRRALCNAATLGDSEQIIERIEEIRSISPHLADGLMSLANDYDYEKILSLLSE